ncbi:hypothetical protein OIV83_005009 [Microbotryomycetes sp. JL201]|nr:hypothetical protein OIV83_005009 [Microbotryomycetes sp. JL201]
MSLPWIPLPDWNPDTVLASPPPTPPAATTSLVTIELIDRMAPMAPVPATQSRITLQKRPEAEVSPDLTGNGHFLLETNVPIDKDLKDTECLVKVEYVSLDPAMRGWLNATRSYIAPVAIGAVMRAGAVGRIASLPASSELARQKQLAVGDWVSVLGGWQEYAKVQIKEIQKIPPPNDKVQPSYYLGALGMPGQTAYWGLFDVLKIKKGETIVITGAAGAVGSVACQICKIKGLRVIAVAGGPEKCKWLEQELGVDKAIDYKSPTFKQDFKTHVGYLDCMFDNVGGDILDYALGRLKKGARIALSGGISVYNDKNPKGLSGVLNLVSQSALMQGFIVFNYADKYHIADKDLQQWVNEGKLKVREHRLVGLDKCVEGLLGLFKGINTGKMIVKIGDDGSKL